MSDDSTRSEESFPSTGRKRAQIAAVTGLKIGANYARYLARRTVGAGDAAAERRELHDRNAHDLFDELTKLRGTALKLAQGLSMDLGVLPEEFITVLSRAQYQVPSMGFPLVRRLVKQGLGKYPEDVFASFDAQAVAAASLGQVHRATLKDGRDVAVKVQYPNVRESIDADLRVVRGIAQRVVGSHSVDPYLDEVRDRLREETDYENEGRNIEFFAEQYHSEHVLTPRWIPEYTVKTVLVMTFVEGRHLDEFLSSDPSQEVRDAFGQLLWDFVHDQVAADHLTVHADAHPGNFLFRDDGRLGLLDFGCVKRFPRAFRDDLLRMFKARLDEDPTALAEQYRALEIVRPGLDEEQRRFLMSLLEDLGRIAVSPYRVDSFDFGEGSMLTDLHRLMPRLTGRDAFRNREPVGSPQFVYVNRLLAGMLSILTRLAARVDVRRGRALLLQAVV